MVGFIKDIVDYAVNDNSQELMDEYNANALKYAQQLAYYEKILHSKQNQKIADYVNENIAKQNKESCRWF